MGLLNYMHEVKQNIALDSSLSTVCASVVVNLFWVTEPHVTSDELMFINPTLPPLPSVIFQMCCQLIFKEDVK